MHTAFDSISLSWHVWSSTQQTNLAACRDTKIKRRGWAPRCATTVETGEVLLVFVVCNVLLPSYGSFLWTKQEIIFFPWLKQKWDFPSWKRLRILDWNSHCRPFKPFLSSSVAVLLLSLPCSADFIPSPHRISFSAWDVLMGTAEQHQWAEISSAAVLALLWAAEALARGILRGRHISFSRKATALHRRVNNIEQTSWSPMDFFFSLFLAYSFFPIICAWLLYNKLLLVWGLDLKRLLIFFAYAPWFYSWTKARTFH